MTQTETELRKRRNFETSEILKRRNFEADAKRGGAIRVYVVRAQNPNLKNFFLCFFSSVLEYNLK